MLCSDSSALMVSVSNFPVDRSSSIAGDQGWMPIRQISDQYTHFEHPAAISQSASRILGKMEEHSPLGRNDEMGPGRTRVC